MTVLDTQKIVRLRRDLGNNTSMVRDLIASFEADVAALGRSAATPLPERADAVHLVTGTAAMLAPSEAVGRLNELENSLRDGVPRPLEFVAVLASLDKTVAALQSWVENAPPDGEPSITN